MAKTQKNFLKKHTAASMRNGVAGGNDFSYSISISDITTIIQDIESAIRSENPQRLEEILNQEFIHSEILNHVTEKDGPHNTQHDYCSMASPTYFPEMPGMNGPFDEYLSRQYTPPVAKLISYDSNTYYYETHAIQPVIEVLVLEHYTSFLQLFTLAKETNNGCLNILLGAFAHKDFTTADFSTLDLSHANFSQTNLDNVKFGTIDEIDFTAADLSKSKITKEQIYTAKTYQDAVLPKGYWQFWSTAQHQTILQKINTLRESALGIQNKEPQAHTKAMELAILLEQQITHANGKYNEAFQIQFLQQLKDYEKHFEHAPLIQAIVGNIILFILGGAIGYLAALAFRAYRSEGREILFFNKTEIERCILDIEQCATASKINIS